MNRLTSRNKTTRGRQAERRTLRTSLSRLSLILWLQVAILSVAWAQTPEPTTTAPLLTLDEAIRIARGTNREIQISKLRPSPACGDR